jgi:hypothetical protein
MSPNRQNSESAPFSELAQAKRPSLIAEFWYFLKHNKKWWLLPIILVLLLLCLLVFLGGSGAAIFIYPLF